MKKRKKPRIPKPILKNSSNYRSEYLGNDNEDHQIDLYEALSRETRDGSKYLGYLAYEYENRYGSYPLHDDYGEESSPY